MRDYGASRADLFATLDRPNLLPLPAEPYVFARWRRARVAPDYHIEADGCWYSVPFGLIRQLVDLRITQTAVEVFHRGKRVASHARNPGRRSHVTVPDWTCLEKVPVSLLFHAAFFSKATGLLPARAECRRLGL